MRRHILHLAPACPPSARQCSCTNRACKVRSAAVLRCTPPPRWSPQPSLQLAACESGQFSLSSRQERPLPPALDLCRTLHISGSRPTAPHHIPADPFQPHRGIPSTSPRCLCPPGPQTAAQPNHAEGGGYWWRDCSVAGACVCGRKVVAPSATNSARPPPETLTQHEQPAAPNTAG